MFTHTKKREIPDLNVVPILDMLVCVIFFLLLGTSFTQLTKLSLPPSAVSTISDPLAAPPLAPQLIATEKDGMVRLTLSWAGAVPGEAVRNVTAKPSETSAERNEILKAATELVHDLTARFPKEKTIRIALGAEMSYQKMVTIMDGVKEKMPDIVLTSYVDAQARADRAKPE